MILSWILLLLAGGAVGGSAWGASAMVVQVRDGQSGGDTPTPMLLAEPGEANRVRVAPGPTDRIVLIDDLGAVLEGCVAIDAHHARCEDVAPGEPVLVHAGDLDDIVVALPGTAIDAYGGPGADRLTGADRSDRLFGGGGGRDVLAGMGGDDVLGGGVSSPSTAVNADVLDGGAGNDVVSYWARPTAVHVGLGDTTPDGQAGEGDVLTSIEGAYGGDGADQLIGSAESNVLKGGASRDLIDAGAGADAVDGGRGADRIRSGAGADVVAGGEGDDRISLGSGDDIVYDKRRRAATGADQISCGSGRDEIKDTQSKNADRLARDCELFTAVERLIDDNLVAAADAVTVRLRDLRRSGTSVLVPVRCAREKNSPACVITSRLRAISGDTTLAVTAAGAKVKPGRHATLGLRLTAAGKRHVRRGKQVRLLIAEHTARRAAVRLHRRARAQAQVVMR